MITIQAAKGCSRSFDFQIHKAGVAQNLANYPSITVVVDDPVTGQQVYNAICPQKGGDVYTRVVTVEGTATATPNTYPSCVHWTDTGGKTDAEQFYLKVFDHA